ncbi:MAG: ABC transporter permease [Chromatiales bacterium]|nr:ABC transporter permease [Gammaproteobacteria bacterium]MCB1876329.1 ABC transporter permease [Chromatiales bacterium]
MRFSIPFFIRIAARLLRIASLDHLWRQRVLLREMVRREIHAQYIGAVGGVWWALFRPLITLAGYYFVFSVVLAVRVSEAPAGSRDYGLFLVSGLIPWLAFSEAVVQGTRSLIASAQLLKKAALPAELFPASSALAPAVSYLPFLVLPTVLAWWSENAPFWGLVWLPGWIVLQVGLMYYLSLVLAILSAALKDVAQMVRAVIAMLIFFSPILFPIERVPSLARGVLWLNPVTPLVDGYHSIVLFGRLPDLHAFVGVLAWIALLALLSKILLRRSRAQLVDWL